MVLTKSSSGIATGRHKGNFVYFERFCKKNALSQPSGGVRSSSWARYIIFRTLQVDRNRIEIHSDTLKSILSSPPFFCKNAMEKYLTFKNPLNWPAKQGRPKGSLTRIMMCLTRIWWRAQTSQDLNYSLTEIDLGLGTKCATWTLFWSHFWEK